MSNIDDNLPIYFEGYLTKKEDSKTWETYWVVLRGRYLIFYSCKSLVVNAKNTCCGCIELSSKSKCVISKRKNYSFPFYIITHKARYLVKTKSNLLRHQWINAIHNSSEGKPPGNIPVGLRPILDTVKEQKKNFDDEDVDANDDTLERHNDQLETINSKLINVYSAASDNCTSKFLERTFSDHEEEEPSSNNDLVIMDLEKSNPERFAERLHHIFCQEEIEQKPAKEEETKSINHKWTDIKPVESFSYPAKSLSAFSSSSFDRVSRLTKSAETLKGFHFAANNNQSHQTTYENKHLTKMIFSRHLVNSVPGVKSTYNHS